MNDGTYLEKFISFLKKFEMKPPFLRILGKYTDPVHRPNYFLKLEKYTELPKYNQYTDYSNSFTDKEIAVLLL